MDERKEEQKNDIILVVKKAIGDKIEIDDIIDSEDVDIIAKKVADRLYMDGWRKENPQEKSKDEKKQIEEMAKDIYSIEEENPICEAWNCNGCRYEEHKQDYYCDFVKRAEKLYDKGYRKQTDTVKEFVEKIYNQMLHISIMHSINELNDGLTVSSVYDIIFCTVKEYGVKID